MNLTSKTTIKKLLKKYQSRALKRLGQNFFIDKGAVEKIIKAAGLKDNDVILEIGPGIGAITQEIAKRAKKVIAVEKDPKMREILKETIENFKNVEVIEGDILKLKLSIINNQLSHPYKIAANLPFHLTAPVIRKFLEISNPPKEMILVVQKEVAQRICARPPHFRQGFGGRAKMNLLAVSVQVFADVKIISYISKKSFWPMPKVDSAILKITSREKPAFPQIGGRRASLNFFKIVKAGFSQPRKQILNNLKNGLKLNKTGVEKWLAKNNIQPTQRAETLSIQDWLNLYKTLRF